MPKITLSFNPGIKPKDHAPYYGKVLKHDWCEHAPAGAIVWGYDAPPINWNQSEYIWKPIEGELEQIKLCRSNIQVLSHPIQQPPLVQTNIKPLVVRFNHGFMRPNLNDNTTKVFRTLGADFHDFTPNWKIVQKLMLRSFLDKGDFCWHCHTGIFSYPLRIALKFNVPLVFWGEPQSEITSYYDYLNDECL